MKIGIINDLCKYEVEQISKQAAPRDFLKTIFLFWVNLEPLFLFIGKCYLNSVFWDGKPIYSLLHSFLFEGCSFFFEKDTVKSLGVTFRIFSAKLNLGFPKFCLRGHPWQWSTIFDLDVNVMISVEKELLCIFVNLLSTKCQHCIVLKRKRNMVGIA